MNATCIQHLRPALLKVILRQGDERGADRVAIVQMWSEQQHTDHAHLMVQSAAIFTCAKTSVDHPDDFVTIQRQNQTGRIKIRLCQNVLFQHGRCQRVDPSVERWLPAPQFHDAGRVAVAIVAVFNHRG